MMLSCWPLQISTVMRKTSPERYEPEKFCDKLWCVSTYCCSVVRNFVRSIQFSTLCFNLSYILPNSLLVFQQFRLIVVKCSRSRSTRFAAWEIEYSISYFCVDTKLKLAANNPIKSRKPTSGWVRGTSTEYTIHSSMPRPWATKLHQLCLA